MIERRTARRQRVLRHGTLAFRSGGAIDCTVRNISSKGAQLVIANPIGVPRAFTLVVASERILRRCHAVWSSDKRIGVAFD